MLGFEMRQIALWNAEGGEVYGSVYSRRRGGLRAALAAFESTIGIGHIRAEDDMIEELL